MKCDSKPDKYLELASVVAKYCNSIGIGTPGGSSVKCPDPDDVRVLARRYINMCEALPYRPAAPVRPSKGYRAFMAFVMLNLFFIGCVVGKYFL